MTKYDIRTSEPSDVDGILEVERNCFDEPDLTIVRFCGTCETHLVAETDDEIVGYALAVTTSSESARLLSIGVLEDYRESGIATSLLEEIISRLKERGISRLSLEVRVSNRTAKSLYSNFGFEIGRLKNNYYADDEDAYVMVKDLEIESG